MRIAVEHHSHYRFSEPQARLVQMLRLTPSDTQQQTVVSWHIGVDCDARLRTTVDGYGNMITMLYAEGPLKAIEINVMGEVLVAPNSGVIYGSEEPLQPLFYRRSTARTLANEAIAAFAADSIRGASGGLDVMHLLNAALHDRFPQALDRQDDGVTAAEAFATSGTIASRDATQILLAAARSLNVPARYVSGYRWDGERSHSAPHGWAEAYVEDFGWVGFDPATGLSPNDTYVRVAVGLDAPGAAAIAGMRMGQGTEHLDVALQVDAVNTTVTDEEVAASRA